MWQWCSDWFGPDYYKQSPATDPEGPPAGSVRVVRGGGWYFDAPDCRSADRFCSVPGARGRSGGFRVVAER